MLSASMVCVRVCVDDIPVENVLIHDVPAEIIYTPTQVILKKDYIPKANYVVKNTHRSFWFLFTLLFLHNLSFGPNSWAKNASCQMALRDM